MSKDLDLTFNIHPITGDLPVRKGVKAIMQSMRSIIMTASGDVPFDPNGWGDLYDELGELAHQTTALNIKQRIEDALRVREPRAEIVDITVTPYDTRRGYEVIVRFYELNNPIEHSVTVPLTRLK